jgi:uncharacterized PurR-regulated membrane protein YhhQ (DUF165 family)
VAFLLSETADALVWTYLREHRGWWARAMGAADLAGQAADSFVFILLAFGIPGLPLFLLGQVIGKAYTTYVAMAAFELWRRLRKRKPKVVPFRMLSSIEMAAAMGIPNPDLS